MRLRGGGPTPACLFLFTGEGAHAAETDVASLKATPSWSAVAAALHKHLGEKLDVFLAKHLGEHAAPCSPTVTTILNLLNSDRLRAAGHIPNVVLGHSVGEVGAASGYSSYTTARSQEATPTRQRPDVHPRACAPKTMQT